MSYKATPTFLPYTHTAMGDTLTDWACDSATFARNWKTKLNDSLNTAATAAVIGAAAAGLLGGLLKRPLLGAAVGAAAGWAAHAVWTAPLTEE